MITENQSPTSINNGREQNPSASAVNPAHNGKTPGSCLHAKARPWPGFAAAACVLFSLELLLRATLQLSIPWDGFPVALMTSVALAALITLVGCLPAKSEKTGFIFTIVLLELCTVWYLVAYFTEDSYKVFMQPAMIFQGAGNVMTGFAAQVKNVFTAGFSRIMLYHVPVILYIIFGSRFFRFRVEKRLTVTALLLAVMLWGVVLGNVFCQTTETLAAVYSDEYRYNEAVCSFGLAQALSLELRHNISGSKDEELNFHSLTAESTPSSAEKNLLTDPAPKNEEAEAEVQAAEAGYNVMDIDFDTLIANSSGTVKSLHQYVATQTPSNKNEYTGLFKGKNLILITAEAFSMQVIDEERTPALWRLAHKGIVFENFYQPAWGGSTSTGEYSFLTGLVPTYAGIMADSQNINMYLTMGNQLQRLGYFSAAYHDGIYTYYNRDQTHPNLGYSTWMGMGNGMEQGISGGFPESDLEMINYTAPMYIDQQPFSVYYMTISGHASYAFSDEINDLAVKNEDTVSDMTCSYTLKAYYAANMELEYAMESLLQQLEEAGIADDTVIALVPDHYPYGLQQSYAWGTYNNSLEELIGGSEDDCFLRDRTAAILWCGCLEDRDEPIVVSTPTYSLDMVPTLSNLFGVEYDSRLLVGRDVFSDAEPLVLWPNYYWITDKGVWNNTTRTFTPNEGVEVDEGYIDRISAIVKDKITYSDNCNSTNYFDILFGDGENSGF